MFNEQDKSIIIKSIGGVSLLLAVFLLAKVATEVKTFRTIGDDSPATNVISVSGQGEATLVPNVSEIRFSVSKKTAKMSDAQSYVATTSNKAIESIKSFGVSEKDIKTESYTTYPVYEWQQTKTICTEFTCPPSGKQILTGYQSTQTILIKVREIDKAGDIVDALGKIGVTSIDGPNFTIDDKTAVESVARREAIKDAEEKAKTLAKDLGVKLVRITSFSENNGGATPLYFAKEMSAQADVSKGTNFSEGEQKVTSNVTITYEIR